MKNQLHRNFCRDFMTFFLRFLAFGIIFIILCSKLSRAFFIEKINGFVMKCVILAFITQ